MNNIFYNPILHTQVSEIHFEICNQQFAHFECLIFEEPLCIVKYNKFIFATDIYLHCFR